MLSHSCHTSNQVFSWAKRLLTTIGISFSTIRAIRSLNLAKCMRSLMLATLRHSIKRSQCLRKRGRKRSMWYWLTRRQIWWKLSTVHASSIQHWHITSPQINLIVIKLHLQRARKDSLKWIHGTRVCQRFQAKGSEQHQISKLSPISQRWCTLLILYRTN